MFHAGALYFVNAAILVEVRHFLQHTLGRRTLASTGSVAEITFLAAACTRGISKVCPFSSECTGRIINLVGIVFPRGTRSLPAKGSGRIPKISTSASKGTRRIVLFSRIVFPRRSGALASHRPREISLVLRIAGVRSGIRVLHTLLHARMLHALTLPAGLMHTGNTLRASSLILISRVHAVRLAVLSLPVLRALHVAAASALRTAPLRIGERA